MENVINELASARLAKLAALVDSKEKAEAKEKEALAAAERAARETTIAEYKRLLPELGTMCELVKYLHRLDKIGPDSPIYARDLYTNHNNPNDFGVYWIRGVYGFAYISNTSKYSRNLTYIFSGVDIRMVKGSSYHEEVGDPMPITVFDTKTIGAIVENMVRTIAAVNEMVDKL